MHAKKRFSLDSISGVIARRKGASFVLWGAFHLAILVGFVLAGGLRIETDIFAIVPDSNSTPGVAAAEKVMSARLGGGFYALVGADDPEVAASCADGLARALAAIPGVARASSGLGDAGYAELRRYFFDYRYQLLPPAVGEELAAGGAPVIGAAALERAYGPLAIGALDRLDLDPFLLAESAQDAALAAGLGGGIAATIKNGHIMAAGEGKEWAVVSGELDRAEVGSAAGSGAVPSIKAAAEAAAKGRPGVEVILSGIPFHTWESATGAQADIGVISGVSIAIVIALALLAFGSVVPLAFTLGSITIGTGAAICGTMLVFGELHILALVFGTSLIGTGVDYAMHHFAEWRNRRTGDTPRSVAQRVFPAIFLGFVTTLISYVALCAAPLALIKQLSVFSIFGLLSAFLSQALVAPLLPLPARGGERRSFGRAVLVALGRLRPRRRGARVVLAIAAAALVAFGVGVVRVHNEMRDLYSPSPARAEAERRAAVILGLGQSGAYFLIGGTDRESVLQKEEALAAALRDAGFTASQATLSRISAFAPSLAAQGRNAGLSEGLLDAAGNQLAAFGFGAPELAELRGDAKVALARRTSVEAMRGLPLAALADRLWIGPAGALSFSAAMLTGEANQAPALKERIRVVVRTLDGVAFIDKSADISRTLQGATMITLVFLAASYAATFLLLLPRYGARRSAIVTACPLAASVVVVATLGFIGLPLNLFAVVALVLVLGMGVDYALFHLEGSHDPETTMFGVVLALLTTLFGYGALGLSSFQPARVFGAAIAVGIMASFILAPIAAGRRRQGRESARAEGETADRG